MIDNHPKLARKIYKKIGVHKYNDEKVICNIQQYNLLPHNKITQTHIHTVVFSHKYFTSFLRTIYKYRREPEKVISFTLNWRFCSTISYCVLCWECEREKQKAHLSDWAARKETKRKHCCLWHGDKIRSCVCSCCALVSVTANNSPIIIINASFEIEAFEFLLVRTGTNFC